MNIITEIPSGINAIVVGAGFAGATCARALAEQGRRVLLIEKRGHVGGNAYDCADGAGVLVHRYGPHIFHTNDLAAFAWLSRFGEWTDYEHRVLGQIGGKLVSIPFNFDSIDALFPMEVARRLIEKLLGAYPVDARVPVSALTQSIDPEIANLGRYVFENVFKNYTQKQWGAPVGDVDAATLSRVPVVIGRDGRYFQDAVQAMPKVSYTQVFESMLAHENIRCILNTRAESVLELAGGGQIALRGVPFDGDVIYSGAPDRLLNYKFGRLSYRSLELEFETLPVESYQPVAVVNYPNEHEFTRITEFKKLTGQSLSSATSIMREYPVSCESEDQEPYYPIENAENRAQYEAYRDALEQWPKLHLCGRLAEYRYYNMDAAVQRALSLARELR